MLIVEAFFLLNNFFYIFSKNDEKGKLYKVSNTVGNNEALFLTHFKIDGKQNKVTSADCYKNKIILLNHEKVWILGNFKNDDFFKGDIKSLDFNHNSQKEGVCFKDSNTILITDETKKGSGGNIYTFKLN